MAEINFNSIYDGVSLALHAAFPAAQVHGGNVKQGLKPGDFNVIMPGASHAKEVGQRYKRTPTVDVIYYPKTGDAECYGMHTGCPLSWGASQPRRGTSSTPPAVSGHWRRMSCMYF